VNGVDAAGQVVKRPVSCGADTRFLFPEAAAMPGVNRGLHIIAPLVHRRQVRSYLRYTGPEINVVVAPARGPMRSIRSDSVRFECLPSLQAHSLLGRSSAIRNLRERNP
jgi:hypothetical protein